MLTVGWKCRGPRRAKTGVKNNHFRLEIRRLTGEAAAIDGAIGARADRQNKENQSPENDHILIVT